MRMSGLATADQKYAALEKKLLAAEKAGDDVKVNLIAQQMAELEAEIEATIFDENCED
jgi:hypothetical protein